MAIILVAVVVGILAAGFASWYRNFLRSSQERARQNRAAREQQQRVKAKEDARLARSSRTPALQGPGRDDVHIQQHDPARQALTGLTSADHATGSGTVHIRSSPAKDGSTIDRIDHAASP